MKNYRVVKNYKGVKNYRVVKKLQGCEQAYGVATFAPGLLLMLMSQQYGAQGIDTRHSVLLSEHRQTMTRTMIHDL